MSGERIEKNASNMEEMIDKYTKREKEDTQKVLEKYGVEDQDQLLLAAKKTIDLHGDRTSSFREKIEDPTILREAQDAGTKKEIQEVTGEYEREVSSMAKDIIALTQKEPNLKGKLVGRVTQLPPQGES